MTYKIKFAFFHPQFVHSGNSQGYSGVAGTEVPKEVYEKVIATDKDLAARFEQEGVIPSILKSAAELKDEIAELTKILAQKEKEAKKNNSENQ